MTIKDLKRHSGLSRSALLYYDSLGLLPCQRGPQGYRIYTQETLAILDRFGFSAPEQEQILSRTLKDPTALNKGVHHE